jgi:hypothetical protein
MRIFHIDVESADAALLVMANGKTLLIDSGGNGKGLRLKRAMDDRPRLSGSAGSVHAVSAAAMVMAASAMRGPASVNPVKLRGRAGQVTTVSTVSPRGSKAAVIRKPGRVLAHRRKGGSESKVAVGE